MTGSRGLKGASYSLFALSLSIALNTRPLRHHWDVSHHCIYSGCCTVLLHLIIIWQLLVSVQSVRKIHASYPTVSMNLKKNRNRKQRELVWTYRNAAVFSKTLTFIFTVSTYLVPNNTRVTFAKLILTCSKEEESLIGTNPEYIFAFIFLVKVVRMICRQMTLSSVTWKLSKTKNVNIDDSSYYWWHREGLMNNNFNPTKLTVDCSWNPNLDGVCTYSNFTAKLFSSLLHHQV